MMRTTLLCATPPEWVATVLADLDAFLLDHAACERKASATALTLVAHYPDRPALVEAMLELAAEELDHFRGVYRLLRERGLTLAPDTRDSYVRALRSAMRTGPDANFLDRLLVGAVVEARGCERFGLVHEALEPGSLKEFYREITASEARHQDLFVRVAREYFDDAEVDARLEELLVEEARVTRALPHRPALH